MSNSLKKSIVKSVLKNQFLCGERLVQMSKVISVRSPRFLSQSDQKQTHRFFQFSKFILYLQVSVFSLFGPRYYFNRNFSFNRFFFNSSNSSLKQTSSMRSDRSRLVGVRSRSSLAPPGQVIRALKKGPP